MSKYEMDSHLSLSDRVLVYVGFGAILMLTVYLYVIGADGFSRLSLYATIIAFFPTSWAWMAGHYSKKLRYVVSDHAERATLYAVPPLQEARYAYKGDIMPLAEALGSDI